MREEDWNNRNIRDRSDSYDARDYDPEPLYGEYGEQPPRVEYVDEHGRPRRSAAAGRPNVRPNGYTQGGNIRVPIDRAQSRTSEQDRVPEETRDLSLETRDLRTGDARRTSYSRTGESVRAAETDRRMQAVGTDQSARRAQAARAEAAARREQAARAEAAARREQAARTEAAVRSEKAERTGKASRRKEAGDGQIRPPKRRRKSRNKVFARITYLFVFLFLCLMGYIVYFNIVKAPEVVSSPYNARADLFADRVIKGKILARDGETLAETLTDEAGNSYREYPYGSMFSHVVGYDTNGKSGLESSGNMSMVSSNAFILERIVKELRGEKNIGDNIVTTLDLNLQQTAYDALGDQKGAVVVMEPSTGKIRAMVSKPDFDPNWVSENWEELNSDDVNSPLLNRATQGMYPPGSTFKILTSLEFMREESHYDDYGYECDGSITDGDITISCFNGAVHGSEDLRSSFANSCNSSFVNIGTQLDLTSFRETAESLLFNSKLPCDIYASQPSFKLDKDSELAEIMMTSMGQGQTLTNPYHMAMIVSTIANGGTLMTPYLIDHIENYNGSRVHTTHPKSYDKLMTAQEASELTEFMKAVVNEGTAQELAYEDYTVAAKTGTAEYSDDKSKAHSWFVGFSNVDNPDLVVAVIVESYDGDSGARSMPIAKQIFDAYYYQ